MPEQIETAWHKAMEDAVLLGLGIIIIHPNFSMERIGPERYLEMADSLKWASYQNTLPKE